MAAKQRRVRLRDQDLGFRVQGAQGLGVRA